jgi:hypothetical protein
MISQPDSADAGSGIGYLLAPVRVSGRRGWLQYEVFSWVLYEELIEVDSYAAFHITQLPGAVEKLYALHRHREVLVDTEVSQLFDQLARSPELWQAVDRLATLWCIGESARPVVERGGVRSIAEARSVGLGGGPVSASELPGIVRHLLRLAERRFAGLSAE